MEGYKMNTQLKITEYDQQAIDFLESTGTTFKIEFQFTGPYWPNDEENRDVYRFTMKNSKGEYSSTFGDSLQNSTRKLIKSFRGVRNSKKSDLQLVIDAGVRPTDKNIHSVDVALRKAAKLWEMPGAYDVLACLTKYDPGTFTDFCQEYGYDDQALSEYPNIMNTYQSVLDEYHALRRMFSSDQLEQLAEIQ
jgi:hypothetical protein